MRSIRIKSIIKAFQSLASPIFVDSSGPGSQEERHAEAIQKFDVEKEYMENKGRVSRAMKPRNIPSQR